MSYHFSKTVNLGFDDALALVKEALKRHNFNVVAEIDVKDNLKQTLNVDFRPYMILAVCNPQLTYRALQAQEKIGTMLPSNIVLQRGENGAVEVSALDPVPSMQAITHVVVDQVAQQIRFDLQKAIEEVGYATDFARSTLVPSHPRNARPASIGAEAFGEKSKCVEATNNNV